MGRTPPSPSCSISTNGSCYTLISLPQKATFKLYSRLHIVFEYVPFNLLNIIESHPDGLHETYINLYIRQLCLAVQECHRHDIIHRDVKPENILIKPDSRENDAVKLCDFGIARHVGGNENTGLLFRDDTNLSFSLNLTLKLFGCYQGTFLRDGIELQSSC